MTQDADVTTTPRLSIREQLRQWTPIEEELAAPMCDDAADTPFAENIITRPDSLPMITGSAELTNDDQDSFLLPKEELNELALTEENIRRTISIQSLLNIGDVIRIRQARRDTDISVILSFTKGANCVSFGTDGRIHIHRQHDIVMHIPRVYDAAAVAPVTEFLPTSDQLSRLEHNLDGPQVVTVTAPQANIDGIIKKLSDLLRRSALVYRENSAALDGMHSVVAHPNMLTMKSIHTLAQETLFPDKDPATTSSPEVLLAVSRAAQANWGFSWARNLLVQRGVIFVLSRQSLKAMVRISRYIRAFRENERALRIGEEVHPKVAESAKAVEEFLATAKELIKKGHNVRTLDDMMLSSRPVGKHANSELHLPFSDVGSDFIQAMKVDALGILSLAQSTALRVAVALLLRATKLDWIRGEDITIEHSRRLLIEMGFAQPFSSFNISDRLVGSYSASLDESFRTANARLASGESAVASFDLSDSMSDMRKAWDEIPVYCIDSETTFDIDDGISFRKLQHEPDNCWIDVHVAHLSAFSQPSGLVGQLARQRWTSRYTVEGTSTMLPSAVTEEFSLGSGKPAITISAKVNSEGEILQTSIRPTQLGKVITLNYDDVGKLLGEQTETTEEELLAVGAKPVKEKELRQADSVVKESESDLKDLHEFALRYAETLPGGMSSLASGKEAHDTASLRVDNAEYPTGVLIDDHGAEATFCVEQPGMQWSILRRQQPREDEHTAKMTYSPSHMIVEVCMQIAGRAAAQWAAERQLALVYSGTGTRVPNEFLEASEGQSTKLETSNFVRLLRASPVEQTGLGYAQYSRVTSPLRRYMDLFNLWQIDAALRLEHDRTSDSKDRVNGHDPASPTRTPLAEEEVQRDLELWQAREQNERFYQRQLTSHWATMSLARAHFLGEARLPKPLRCTIGRRGELMHPTGTSKHYSFLKPDGGRPTFLYHRGHLADLPQSVVVDGIYGKDGNELQAGDVWDVEPKSVDWKTSAKLIVTPLERLEAAQ